MQFLLLNGPNLNRLGTRQPLIYGSDTLEDIVGRVRDRAAEAGATVLDCQSNHEGVLVDWIQEAGDAACGIIINPGAYGHTSIALHDAIRAVAPLPVIELHLSNIHAREPFRHVSRIASVVQGVICGFGHHGYVMALHGMAAHHRDIKERQ